MADSTEQKEDAVKIAFISDTHNLVSARIVPECDVLIHSGDHTARGTRAEWMDAMRWLAMQNGGIKIAIPGNHDFFAQEYPREAESIANAVSVVLLIDQTVETRGLKIYGSPWQPWFFDWAYNFPESDRGEVARAKWAEIPDDVHILVTHGPPKFCLDRTETGAHAGCPYLADRVSKLNRLKVHAFGHIHEGYGIARDNTHPNEALFVNASINDRKYRPLNAPLILDIAA